MKGDLHPAAVRLSSALPVRTHERKPPPRMDKAHFGKGARGRGITVIFGKGGKARPVRIGRVTYETATQAAKMLHKSTAKIYEWLRDGTARYG